MSDNKVTEPGDFEYRDLAARIGAVFSVENQEWELPFFECLGDGWEIDVNRQEKITVRMKAIDSWLMDRRMVPRYLLNSEKENTKLKGQLKRLRGKMTLIRDVIRA